MEFSLPHNLMSLLNFLADVQGRKHMRKGLIMIWQAVIWALWRHRNKIVFENGITDVIGLVEEVKISSWKWWIARSQTLSCLCYEWNQAPTLCLLEMRKSWFLAGSLFFFVTEPPTITISEMANFGSQILDAVDNFPTSTVKIRISERLKDSEYDAIVDFIDNTNDNLKRTALKLVDERVGNDAAGQQKVVLKSFRSGERNSKLCDRVKGCFPS
ncbi:unnamed protein product [Trifolium pratense]|uniref:Uncharacterized protein n=1 Tax=Trifolium pratense TaxID=57577 RepID=A0ACB0J6X2_TRIPR|nr:unnamed protein product [Trifolium pratense]